MKDISLLDEDRVRQIVRLIEALEKSSFDFLQLDVGELKLTLGKGNPPSVASAAPPQLVEAMSAQAAAVPASVPAAAPATTTTSPAEEGTVGVYAPIVGLFYSRPDPAAPPFVSVGAKVSKGSTVGLIEVMKVFNAVPAGIDGVITEVCVDDAQAVEFGQLLFRVRPDATS